MISVLLLLPLPPRAVSRVSKIIALSSGISDCEEAAALTFSLSFPSGTAEETALFSAGAGLVCAGVAILLFYAGRGIAGGLVKLTGKALLAVKTRLVGKEG